jgi:Protein of unknown function (DUF4013)
MTYVPPPPPPPPPPGPSAGGTAATLPPPIPPPNPNQFDFGKPFTYVFDDPRWMQKVLIGGLFYLAGFLIIGWFFLLGYMARVARNVITDQPAPLPEWDDLGEFFNDGARLVGVMLCYMAPFFGLGMFFIFPAILADASGNEEFSGFVGGMMGCVWCLMVPLGLAVMITMPASLLFAAVERRFSAAFEFGRIFAFIRNNVGNYLLAVVVYLVARFLGGFGIFLLCVGVVFTGFWALLIMTHGFAQVYRIATKQTV